MDAAIGITCSFGDGAPPSDLIDGTWPSSVADILKAKARLQRMSVEHWVAVEPESLQIFMYDPFGNMMVTEPSGAR